MSLILDALKKLDREKSSRRDGNANIAAGILRPAPPRPGRKNRLYVVAASLSALAAAGVTYAVMEHGSPQKTQITGPGPATAQSPAPAKQQAAAFLPAPEPARGGRPDVKQPPEKVQTPVERKEQPVSPALLAKTASPAAARAAAAPSPPPGANPLPPREQTPPARDSREAAPAAPVKNQSSPEIKAALPPAEKAPARKAATEAPAVVPAAPVKDQNPPETKAAPPPAEKTPARKAAPEAPAVVPAAPMKPADAVPATPVGDPPSLKLSGIVWHEEPAARRAVVNGTFAAEGSVVEGVKVVEIHPNRVAFSYNGRPFEIVMFR